MQICLLTLLKQTNHKKLSYTINFRLSILSPKLFINFVNPIPSLKELTDYFHRRCYLAQNHHRSYLLLIEDHLHHLFIITTVITLTVGLVLLPGYIVFQVEVLLDLIAQATHSSF